MTHHCRTFETKKYFAYKGDHICRSFEKFICAYKGEQLSGVVSRAERGLPPAREGHPTSRATDPKHLDLFGNSKMDLFGTGIFILAEGNLAKPLLLAYLYTSSCHGTSPHVAHCKKTQIKKQLRNRDKTCQGR